MAAVSQVWLPFSVPFPGIGPSPLAALSVVFGRILTPGNARESGTTTPTRKPLIHGRDRRHGTSSAERVV